MQDEQPTQNSFVEEKNFDNPDFKFVPNERHNWKQRGPYIVCNTCDLEHALAITVNKRLVGIDRRGNPILKDV
jgi:hypothetical protein